MAKIETEDEKIVKAGKRLQTVPREQYEHWFETLHTKECLLCNAKKQKLIREWKYWIFIENISPYFNFHSMLVPKRHILHLGDISLSEFKEFKTIYPKIITAYGKAGFKHENGKPVVKHFWFVRSRDYNFDHSSDLSRPEHLHIHIAPDYKGFFDPILHPNAYKTGGFGTVLRKYILDGEK